MFAFNDSFIVARFGLFRPNWSFQTSFGPQKFHLVFGLILVFLGHSDWSFGPFWSFLVFFLMNFWDFGLFEIFLLLSVNLAVLKIF